MSVVRATSVEQAVDALAEVPGALLVAGGTEVMVALAERRLDPPRLVTLRRVPELRGVLAGGERETVLGALTTYTDLAGAGTDLAGAGTDLAGAGTDLAGAGTDLAGLGRVDVLAAMAATVGSPASRNGGTLGGALGTASGVGDAVTALLALDAVVLSHDRAGPRRVPVPAWLDGSGRRVGDVVTGVAVPRTIGGQHYLKPGERQAVSYGLVSCALVVDGQARRVRIALGSVGPVPWRSAELEDWLADRLEWSALAPLPDGPLAAELAVQVRRILPEPSAGLRISSAHRRHVAGVLASRALARASTTAQAAA